MSRDIPIIFSAPMVQALLAGRKTMTRRLAWKDPFSIFDDEDGHQAQRERKKGCKVSGPDDLGTRIAWPASPWQKVKVGDRLWVRESITQSGALTGYMAGGPSSHIIWPAEWNAPSRPSIHMPRKFSRLTLIVTGTKVERLTAISEIDALAEGILYENVIVDAHGSTGTHIEITADRYWNGAEDDEFEGHESAGDAFEDLWTRLHGADAWIANPEVVALSFKVIKSNIDTPEARSAA
jgi:hypothetical protein